MSTAAAPVVCRNAALQACATTTSSTPASPPLTTRRRPSATLAICSSLSETPASQRASPATTAVATTTSPDFNEGSSPPATPNETTPRIVAGSNTVSSARNCCGSLALQTTAMPGPAAMRASCTRPVTIKTGRRSILPAHGPSPTPKFTSRPLPPCCWSSSGSDSAQAPKAERTSHNHDSADKTPVENPLPYTDAHPTDLFGSARPQGTPPRGPRPGARPHPPPSGRAKPMPFATQWWAPAPGPGNPAGNSWHPHPSRRPGSGPRSTNPRPCESWDPGG